VFYEDIGGLDDAIRKIREMVELPIKHPELFQRLGISPPKGVLLYGPPGTGKTLLAKAVATETNANFYHISGPEIVSKFVGESEERLRKIFENARKNAPSIIFIDEIDSIAPKRSEIKGEVEKRLVAQLLTLMDGLESRGDVVVIAATNRPNDIDEALRRPGRFDREIEINPPDRDGRLEILRIHTRKMPLDKDVKLEEIADITHGFTGADLEALCKEAALTTLRRYLKDEEIQKQLDEGKLDMATLQKIVVSKQDFYEALNHVQPSALREIYVQKPNVRWEDVGGMSKVKKELQEIIYYTLKNPEKMEEYGLTPIKGVLLYGPPGTGKTLLAKAVATEANANFIAINGPEILSKWVGESERAIRELLKKARQNSPTVVFIDEIDSIAPKRSEDDPTRVGERLVSTLLTELDGIKSNRKILILGATNRLDMIDPALLRPGRFDRIIEIKPPNKEDRLEILKIHTRKMPLEEDVNLEQIAEITEGFTGAQLSDIVRKAALQALRNNTKVKQEYFIKAIEESKEKTNIKGYL
jgi:transitional endoplasmic reticulum ATPase